LKCNIDFQTVKGSSAEKAEERVLDWKEVRNDDGMLGPVTTRARCGYELIDCIVSLLIVFHSRRVQVSELDVDFLKQGWTADTVQHGLVQISTRSDKPWTANQVGRAFPDFSKN
jgi:hypothetical protein